MTFTEYNLLGQEMIYSVYTFPIKPVAFTDIFLNPEKFSKIQPWLGEIFSIASQKPSINTFQSSKGSKGYLSFGKMAMDGKKDFLWLEKYVGTEGWNHCHTDFWVPQKTTAIKNYVFPEIVVCIYGDGKLRSNPSNENFYCNNFSIIIKDELLQDEAREKITGAVGKIKEQLHDCYYFHFKAPWVKCDNVMISETGAATFILRYTLANVDGAFLSLGCIDYFTDCKWKSIYCDESEIIEKALL
ncbi:hypothetical protein [Pinibacter aurantiacus]|uniref:Uncharacterized protein n=1 Tax=Pinibacter aurantiacus TaxID=2851599 RepID=A0A9E2S645_9BACT|nr:hypothetical protein [Pinibacter aurantiacus]MBV4355918.1 hypothetical protein [Pinibacter aurantiacus]